MYCLRFQGFSYTRGAVGAWKPQNFRTSLRILRFYISKAKEVSVVMWLAPWSPVRETRVQIPEQHGNLVKFILVWVFFNPSGILTQP